MFFKVTRFDLEKNIPTYPFLQDLNTFYMYQPCCQLCYCNGFIHIPNTLTISYGQYHMTHMIWGIWYDHMIRYFLNPILNLTPVWYLSVLSADKSLFVTEPGVPRTPKTSLRKCLCSSALNPNKFVNTDQWFSFTFHKQNQNHWEFRHFIIEFRF